MPSHSSVAELRRERDMLRSEMEANVRNMQFLEEDIERYQHTMARSEMEAKRAQLASLREKLGELKKRMRIVMDNAARYSSTPSASPALSQHQQQQQQQQHELQGTSTPHPAGASVRRSNAINYPHSAVPLRRAGLSPTPHNNNMALQQQQQQHPEDVSPTRHHQRHQRHQQPSASAASSSRAVTLTLDQLKQKHDHEKDELRGAFNQVWEKMEQRQRQELTEVERYSQEEARRVREYQDAMQRMEQAKRELDMFHQQQHDITTAAGVTGASLEVELFRNMAK